MFALTASAVVVVSILTRPEGRVQRARGAAERDGAGRFQSSPVPKDGCNAHSPQLFGFLCKFQSSPVPKDGCNQDEN